MAAGSNRKNLAKQLGRAIPMSAKMALGPTVVFEGDRSGGTCITCHELLELGQRLKWCEVAEHVPAGFIHAMRFDGARLFARGRGPARPVVQSRPRAETRGRRSIDAGEKMLHAAAPSSRGP